MGLEEGTDLGVAGRPSLLLTLLLAGSRDWIECLHPGCGQNEEVTENLPVKRGKHYLGSGWATVCAVRIREEETPQCEGLTDWSGEKRPKVALLPEQVRRLLIWILQFQTWSFRAPFSSPRLVSLSFCLSL